MDLLQAGAVYAFVAVQSLAAVVVIAAAARKKRRLVQATGLFAAALVGPGIGDWMELVARSPFWLYLPVQSAILLIGPSLRYLEAAIDDPGSGRTLPSSIRGHALAAISLACLLVVLASSSARGARIVEALWLPVFFAQTAFYLASGLADLRARREGRDPAVFRFLVRVYLACAAAWLVWLLDRLLPGIGPVAVVDRLSLPAIAVLSMLWGAEGALRERMRRDEPYSKSGLDGEASAELAARIVAALEGDSLYMDPDLDLPSLARRLGVDPRKLSQAIGQSLGTGFADYIATLRLRRFRELASDPAYADRGTLDLALEAGFGSKSRFNHLFRKAFGETPSAFRRRIAPGPGAAGDGPAAPPLVSNSRAPLPRSCPSRKSR